MSDYASLLTLPMTVVEREVIDALVEHGSQNLAAEALGYKRTRVQSALRRVQARQRAAVHAVDEQEARRVSLEGRVSTPPPVEMSAASGVSRYILTSAQNNTPVHEAFLSNLEAYAEHVGARIMVSRYSYNKAAYGAKATKAGRAPTAADTQGLWYDPRIEQYVCDDPAKHGSCRYQLAPDLVWCADHNILPTAVRPLSGLESHTGPASGIFPHAKLAMESVPVINRSPKFNFTTGTVTQRNYVAKKDGIKAAFHHAYAALLVEVENDTGHWWVRQLNADDDGSFYDLTSKVVDGEVTTNHRMLAISWGDIHASEIDPEVALVNWGDGMVVGGAIDVLRPQYQFWHDSFSMRTRSHHEAKSYGKRLKKWCGGEYNDTVEKELAVTRIVMLQAHRDWCTTVVVPSNHDEHLDRWLEEADYKLDLPNAEFFLEAQLARTRAIRTGKPWDALRWAIVERPTYSVESFVAGAADWADAIKWLRRDEAFVIGPPGHELEVQHGDLGPNGSRGTTANLARVPLRLIKGHDHTASIRDGVTSGGVCQLKMDYARGPSSWSVSHVGVYENGKRVILSQRDRRLWANQG